MLVANLTYAPSPEWIELFHTQASTQFLGMGPSTVTFNGAIAAVPTTRSIVVMQKSYFEGWIRNTNGLYEEAVKREMEAEKRRQGQELQRELARETERQEILKLLNPS